MRNRHFIYKLLLLGLILIPWSCTRTQEQEPQTIEGEDGAIRFDPAVAMVRDDDTKSTMINGVNTGGHSNSFRVFCRRVGEGKHNLLFGDDGTQVTWNESATGSSKWEYSPLSYWYWISVTNYYDFLAAMYPRPAAQEAVRMLDELSGEEIPGNLAIKKAYALSDDYDLMMAGTRRTGADFEKRTVKVPLTFQHMLCAVRVVVTNESTATNLTLTSVKFDNIIQSAYAKVTIDALGEPEFSWIDTQRTNADKAVFSGSQALNYGGDRYEPASYDLLIPGDLSVAIDGSLEPKVPKREDYKNDAAYNTAMTAYNTALTAFEAQLPRLKITYTTANPDPTGDPIVHAPDPIVLRNVKQARFGSADTIPEWEPGIKYTYNVSIRLDGGVIVTVITSEWDEIIAETPGILI